MFPGWNELLIVRELLRSFVSYGHDRRKCRLGIVRFLFFACYFLAAHLGVSWLVVEVSLGDPVLLFVWAIDSQVGVGFLRTVI